MYNAIQQEKEDDLSHGPLLKIGSYLPCQFAIVQRDSLSFSSLCVHASSMLPRGRVGLKRRGFSLKLKKKVKELADFQNFYGNRLVDQGTLVKLGV